MHNNRAVDTQNKSKTSATRSAAAPPPGPSCPPGQVTALLSQRGRCLATVEALAEMLGYLAMQLVWQHADVREQVL